MERWEHDAFLGFAAEQTTLYQLNEMAKSIEKDIIFCHGNAESIIRINAAAYGFDYEIAEQIYDEIKATLV